MKAAEKEMNHPTLEWIELWITKDREDFSV